ncbi:hypothetical protein A33K_13266 [Burkholderia humptydooensis MSMB43]|uniref:Uncharacterized protein n=1 Tax=Burkholderia humptydooensis MSMB43 TaxID=441157 RepID=A0ABN0GBG3_9BURK|nr:hypothetical protein A33K_13266 [Burkholderia humptydooensis MSMB43]
MSGVGDRLAGFKLTNGFPARAERAPATIAGGGSNAEKTLACARRPRNEARKIA